MITFRDDIIHGLRVAIAHFDEMNARASAKLGYPIYEPVLAALMEALDRVQEYDRLLGCIPKPCMAFINTGADEQYKKINSELTEAMDACFIEKDSEHEFEELCDVIIACVTRMSQLKKTQQEIQDKMWLVNQKNGRRGYL